MPKDEPNERPEDEPDETPEDEATEAEHELEERGAELDEQIERARRELGE